MKWRGVEGSRNESLEKKRGKERSLGIEWMNFAWKAKCITRYYGNREK